MLVKAALVLLVVWALGVFGVYDIGAPVHLFLLVGLLLLLLQFAKQRDPRTQAPPDDSSKTR